MNTFGFIRGGAGGYAAREAAEAKGAARAAGRAQSDLEARLERTLMAVEAMWTLLREKLDLSEEDLIHRINEIDMSDGKLDGKVRKPPVSCPSCGRTISPKFARCMYCGQQVMQDPFA